MGRTQRNELRKPKVKGTHMFVHPDFFCIAEQVRKKMESKGLKSSQLKISQIIAKRLRTRRRGLGILE